MSKTYLHWGEFRVDQDGEATNRNNKELSSEGVMIAVISGFELEVDQEHSEVGWDNEENLHDCVIQGDKWREQI